MEPACAKACPTESIQFGALDELRGAGRRRVEALHAAGVPDARLYGHDPADGVGGDGAFFLLLDEPEVYGLPPDPVVTTRDLPRDVAARRARGRGLAAGVGGLLRRAPTMSDVTRQVCRTRGRRTRPSGPPAGAPRDRVRRERLGRGPQAAARGRAARQLMVPRAEFTSYYGRPGHQDAGVGRRATSPATSSSAGWRAPRRVLAAGAQLTGRPALARTRRSGAAGAPAPVRSRRWCTTSAGPSGSCTCCGWSS